MEKVAQNPCTIGIEPFSNCWKKSGKFV